MADLVDEVLNEDRLKVHKLCQKQLGGVWSDVTESQLIIKRFSKGYVNKLFYCELPDDLKAKSDDQYKSVVVKLSTEFDEHEFFSPLISTLNNLMLSEKKIAPKVLKIFNGGMISEFIDGRSFNCNDDGDNAHVSLLAQKLAQFHSIKMPIPKDNSKNWLTGICDTWFEQSLRNSLTQGDLREAILSQNRETLSNLDLWTEMQWMKKLILASNCPIAFTHCDFNRGNILVRHKNIQSNNNLDIFLIDFDYCCYNYRGLDLGRYFSSWGHKDPMFGFGDFPTDDQMSVFIDAYIEESVKLFGNSYGELEVNSKENIIKEAKFFTLICYLIDVLFCIWMASTDKTKNEEYLEKGETRYHGYYVLKNQFLKDNSLPIGVN